MDVGAAKKLTFFTLSHTAQFIGAVVVISSFAYAFAEPAMRQYVENTVKEPLAELSREQGKAVTEQKAYRKEQTTKTNRVINRQMTIIENQRIGEILDAEQRSKIDEILRIMRAQRN